MKVLCAIIEDDKGHVIGGSTDCGDVMLPAGDQFPRADLRDRALDLATQYGITIPPQMAQALTGAPKPG
jgi:hypothetical protein